MLCRIHILLVSNQGWLWLLDVLLAGSEGDHRTNKFVIPEIFMPTEGVCENAKQYH